MSVDLDIAQRFGAAGHAAYATGDLEGFYALLADDAEWTTPRRTLRGVHEIREKLDWGGGSPEHLDVDFEAGEWEDLGGGRVARENRIVQRWKENGEVAAVMHVREELLIRGGKVARYERRGRPT